MRYINPKSRRGIINKFADFILCEIQKERKYKTIIEVSDFGNFLVVAGKTESKSIIDLSEIKQYIPTFPVDPNVSTGNSTGYAIEKTVDGHITVSAPHAEYGAIVKVTW